MRLRDTTDYIMLHDQSCLLAFITCSVRKQGTDNQKLVKQYAWHWLTYSLYNFLRLSAPFLTFCLYVCIIDKRQINDIVNTFFFCMQKCKPEWNSLFVRTKVIQILIIYGYTRLNNFSHQFVWTIQSKETLFLVRG